MNSKYSNSNSPAQSLESQAVVIKGQKGKTKSTVLIESWPAEKKTREGIKAWVICWLLAVPAVFLPLVHFILVPLLVILGPVLFVVYQKKETMLMGGEGACPDCGGHVEFQKQTIKWPFKVVCGKNYDHLEVHKALTTSS